MKMDEPHPLRHLDPKVKWVWFLPQAALLAALWLMAVIALFVFGAESPLLGLSRPMFALLLLLFITIFIACPVYAYHHMEYMSFTYELGEKELFIRQGIFTRDTVVIPYERIQNINTRRTVLERFLGFASLLIDTAGTNPSAAEGLLPGVSNKDQLIREIMGRVETEKARGDILHNGSGASGAPHSPARASGEGPSERQLLADILKEIVQLKEQLQSRASRSPPDLPRPGASGHAAWPRHSPGLPPKE